MNWKRRLAKEWLYLLGAAVIGLSVYPSISAYYSLTGVSRPASTFPPSDDLTWSIDYLPKADLRRMIYLVAIEFQKRTPEDTSLNGFDSLSAGLTHALSLLDSCDSGDDCRRLLRMSSSPWPVMDTSDYKRMLILQIKRLRALEAASSDLREVALSSDSEAPDDELGWLLPRVQYSLALDNVKDPFYKIARQHYQSHTQHWNDFLWVRRNRDEIVLWSLILSYSLLWFVRSVMWSVQQLRSSEAQGNVSTGGVRS